MDPVVQFTFQVFLTAIIVGFLALIAVVAITIVWAAYHMAHDHWSLAQTWKQAGMKVFPPR